MYCFVGIGHSSSKQLNEMGVVSVKELQDTELSEIKKIFGDAMATTIKQLSLGIDESPVVAFALPQVGLTNFCLKTLEMVHHNLFITRLSGSIA